MWPSACLTSEVNKRINLKHRTGSLYAYTIVEIILFWFILVHYNSYFGDAYEGGEKLSRFAQKESPSHNMLMLLSQVILVEKQGTGGKCGRI